MASKDTQYDYEAGWMDARNVVHEAMEKSRKDSLDGPWPLLHALWESMGSEVRTEKRDAYAREVQEHS